MNTRNLSVLFLCQLISATGSIVIVTLGGIVGTSLAANPALATLPVSVMVVATAAVAVPAAVLMSRFGRKTGFALGSVAAVVAMVVAYASLTRQSFEGFVLAAALLGINMSFTQQYRYAAAESVETAWIGRAVSLVLVGAIGGALLGPELVIRGQDAIEGVPFAGTVLLVAGLYVLQFLLVMLLGPAGTADTGSGVQPQRGLGEIVGQPVFLVAVFGGVSAYGVMSLIMTGTPISMHVHDGYSIGDTAQVIRSHVIGMYAPSLITGWLLDRFGTVRVMAVGALLLLAASAIGLHDRTYLHYWSALVLLGVGWNFLYVGATTMLTRTYQNNERFRAQAVNEICVFGTAAAASLLAGTVVHAQGWPVLVVIPIPVLLVMLIGLYRVRRDSLLARQPAALAATD